MDCDRDDGGVELLIDEDGTIDADAIVCLQQILATETASATIDELVERSHDSAAEIEDHLCDLEERGLVEMDGDMYVVTDPAVEALKRANHYEQIGILYDMYKAADSDE